MVPHFIKKQHYQAVMPKEIQDNNNLYNILSPLVQFGTRCHYNHFCVRGIENLPTDGAYIIAPCHQQALMEPLAVLRIAPKPPVFLARADLFAKPTLRAILTFLRILPVYRIRDGQKNVSKNHAIFEQSCRVLLDGYPLCLMAEGRHNNRHHLLNMGKGMFRIAGEAQQRLGTHPVYIVPTGIDFDEYEQPYSNVVVNIGKPIPLQPFMELYRDNEPVALNQMRDALAEALMPLMHDIRDEEHYDEIMTLCNVLNRNMRRQEGLDNTAWNRFKMRQQISRHMDFLAKDDSNPMFEKLTTAAKQLQEACRRLHLTEKTVSEHWRPVATLLALLPLIALIVAALTVPALRWTLLFCLLCYPMALIPTHLVVKRKVADPQFRSSFNFGIRFFFSILYTIVIGIVMACCKGAWMGQVANIGAWWGLVAVAIVFIEARLAGPLTCFLRNTLSNCHYWLTRLFKHNAMQEIDKTIETLTATYGKERIQ